MLTADDYAAFEARLQAAAVAPTKKAMSLPADLQFFRSLDHEFGEDLDSCSDRLLIIINKLLSSVDTISFKGKGKGRLETVEDVLDNFSAIVGARIDQLLERTDSCLDEFAGRSNKTPVTHVNTTAPTNRKGSKERLHPDLQHAATIAKPQLSFRTPPDNRLDTPWRPPLKRKPNALIPLDPEFLAPSSSDPSQSFPHPYSHEIQHINYPATMFQRHEPQPYGTFEDTPFQWVSTQDELDGLIRDLEGVTEIAIDLEHHDYRTYGGFLCLMQISTRSKDYIVDTLALREELEVLNVVFTNPNVAKVLHGADSDIVWLQQNFGLYIVNLFDTYQASRILGFPKHSLAALLLMYCDFTADKKYQLADWRIRPLPEEMLAYARSDTHYLLFIFDNMRNALLDRGKGQDHLIRTVLERSEETALRLFTKEPYDFETGHGKNGWFNLIQRWNTTLSPLQSVVFKTVHRWRDNVARTEDESPRFIMQNNLLFRIASQPPADMAALKQILNKPSAPVRTRMSQLLDLIRTTVKAELSKPPESPVPKITHDDERPPTVQHVEPLADIWNRIDGQYIISAGSSSLFGTTLNTAPGQLAASSSSLFSSTSFSLNAFGRSAEFNSIVEKIHNSIRQAPTVSTEPAKSSTSSPVIPTPLEAPATAPMEVDPSSSAEGMTSSAAPAENLEIQFVPAAQRGAQATKDEIVVVGKPTKRKRKETLKTISAGTNAEPEGSPSTPKPAFDFGSVPNILDDHPGESQKGRNLRKRQKRASAVEYGNFPAPPKNPSELRNGTRTQTFKK